MGSASKSMFSALIFSELHYHGMCRTESLYKSLLLLFEVDTVVSKTPIVQNVALEGYKKCCTRNI